MDHRIIARKLQLLQERQVRELCPVTGWQVRTATHLAPGRYRVDGPWRSARLPEHYPALRTVFLQASVSVPRGTPLADAYLSFCFQDMEGMLSVNGRPYAGLDWAHPRTPVPRLGTSELLVEWLSVPGAYHDPGQVGRQGTFAGAAVVLVDRLIEGYCFDLRFAWETARVVTEPRRKALLEEALEASLLAVDLTLTPERLRTEVAAARRLLRDRLAGIGVDPESGGIFAVGHTHIDTAWLWPLRETVRKCGRTFSTACRLMERYPDFRFTCSQPQLYAYTKAHYPALYREIRRWVKAGRWETAGAMWVEADCNVTGGEALVRQMLHGIRFLQHEFGTRPRLCWLPDVFGYPSSLPGILAACGVRHFYTYKLHWQATNRFPAHLFRWRGIDGSEILAHVVNHVHAYNNYPAPDILLKGWDMYAQKAEHPEVIFPFGYGDGGGGVNEEEMELLRRAVGRYPGLPAVRLGTAAEFFAAAEQAWPRLPLWDGELYVETHRGTYTTQSAMKRANRTSERLLRDAELLGVLAALEGGPRCRADDLHDAWEQVLLHQFHDILPGSSIGMVYREALATLARVQHDLRPRIDRSLQALAPASAQGGPALLHAVNTLGWERTDLVAVDLAPGTPEPRSVVAADGTRLPAQVVARRPDGGCSLLFRPHGLPAIGAACYRLSADPAAGETGLRAVAGRLENRFFRLTIGGDGSLRRLYDKVNRRDVLAAGAVGNDLQLLQDGPEYEDAWNVHPTMDGRRYPCEGEARCDVAESGPVRAVLRVRRTHRQSVFEQDIILYADLPRIDFVTRIDWQERQTLLKVAFPLAVRATRATYEVQFGAYERPTHRNTSWEQQKFEVPAQRWADLSEAGYGVSLLNDSRYGYDARDNVLRLTLLRGTTFPDPEADRGTHEFTYSLYPHAGNWTDAHTVRRALELNVPVQARLARRAGGVLPAPRSWLRPDGLPVVIETLKPAEDGRGLILRLYEPHGARGRVCLRFGFPVERVVPCNAVEEDCGRARVCRGGVSRMAVGPFELRTLRLLPAVGG